MPLRPLVSLFCKPRVEGKMKEEGKGWKRRGRGKKRGKKTGERRQEIAAADFLQTGCTSIETLKVSQRFLGCYVYNLWLLSERVDDSLDDWSLVSESRFKLNGYSRQSSPIPLVIYSQKISTCCTGLFSIVQESSLCAVLCCSSVWADYGTCI